MNRPMTRSATGTVVEPRGEAPSLALREEPARERGHAMARSSFVQAADHRRGPLTPAR